MGPQIIIVWSTFLDWYNVEAFAFGKMLFFLGERVSKDVNYSFLERTMRMKKSLEKILVMMVSIAMVFTMMAMPVYADDSVVIQNEETVMEDESFEYLENVEDEEADLAIVEESVEGVAADESGEKEADEGATEELIIDQNPEEPTTEVEIEEEDTEEIVIVSEVEETEKQEQKEIIPEVENSIKISENSVQKKGRTCFKSCKSNQTYR